MTKKNKPKVVTSCRGRFHIFDQARELSKQDILYQLITDYPKVMSSRFGIPSCKVRSLIFIGLMNQALIKFRRLLPTKFKILIDEKVHGWFSTKLSKIIPAKANFFIGLSSFSLEAIQFCNHRKILSAVDHGSFHQSESRKLIEQEAKSWGVEVADDICSGWVVEKEDKEFALADFVFVPSIAVKDSLIRNGVTREKIFVNPYGVNLDSFFEGRKTDNVFRVIQVGGITIGKGVLTLIEAFKLAGIENSELVFVGGGPSSSDLSSAIESTKPSNVFFYPPVPQKELRGYYNQSSVFVLASVEDGFGMVVLQAMACGLPVIVTENVGAKDLVVDGINGFVVPTFSPNIIANKLVDLHKNPEKRLAMGVAAKETVVSGYTWDDYGQRLASFVKEKCYSL